MGKTVNMLLVTLATLCPIACVGVNRPEGELGTRPDVDRLMAVASSDEGTDGFKAILKLRDIADERAVPVLNEVLARHVGTNRIHGFAAAQGLFCIGTAEAHEVLRKHLLSDVYSARLGIMYALSGWNMEESKRDPFIAQYHLQSTSRDIGIELTSNSKEEDGEWKTEFTVTLRNESNGPLSLFVPAVYLGEMLIFQTRDGRFLPGGHFVEYEMPEPTFSDISPGKSLEFRISGSLRMVVRFPGSEPSVRCWATRDTIHRLNDAVPCRVYAMYAYEKAYAKRYLKHGKHAKLPENIWYGSAVSEPIEVEIGPTGQLGGR